MATPVLVYATIAGGSGGPAPHHFSVGLDKGSSSTGSEDWQNGYFEHRVRVNGATPTMRITTTDKINGETVYLDADQHGENCNYLCYDTGTVTVETRFRNSAGEWSDWTTTGTFTVTARGSDIVYVDGARADDTGDGLSWATAKKTIAAAITVVNSIGDGCQMQVRDCSVDAGGAAMTADNVWVRKDPAAGSATLTLTGNYSVFQSGTGTNGLVIEGLTIAGSTGRLLVSADANTSYGLCFYNCSHDGCMDFATASGNATVRGISFINITEINAVSDVEYFGNDIKGLLAWGFYAPVGSSTEHLFRFQTVAADCSQHAFMFCHLGVNNAKSCLRWLADYGLRVYGSIMLRTVLVGFASPGGSSVSGTDYVFERCKFARYTGQSSQYGLLIYSGWDHGAIRNCYFADQAILMSARNDETEVHYLDHIDILHNTFVLSTLNQCVNTEYTTLTNKPTYTRIRNNIFRGISSTNRYLWISDVTATGLVLAGNVFERVNGQNIARNIATSTDYAFAAYTALGAVSGETQATTVTVDGTTLEPNVGLTTGIASVPFPFVSYYNGDKYDPTDSNYASGAWLNPSASELIVIPKRLNIATSVGVLSISTES